MPRTGRPRAIDEHKRTAICAVVSNGGSLEEAAQLLGCAVSTIHREKRRNEQFRKELDEAQVNATLTPYRRMNAASRRSWRAAAWMIDQNRPKSRVEDAPPPSLSSPADERPAPRSRPSAFDRLSPNAAALGAYICDRVVQGLRERWGLEPSDPHKSEENPTSDTPSPFATDEESQNIMQGS